MVEGQIDTITVKCYECGVHSILSSEDIWIDITFSEERRGWEIVRHFETFVGAVCEGCGNRMRIPVEAG